MHPSPQKPHKSKSILQLRNTKTNFNALNLNNFFLVYERRKEKKERIKSDAQRELDKR
jgi:hypothetical protein